MSDCKMIVAGYISLDITPVFPENYKGRTMGDIVRPGKLRRVGPAEVSPGGCVSNTGLALHQLGADVALVSKVGDDEFGRLLQDTYRRKGADAEFIVSKDVDTSYTLVIAPPGSDRCFLVDSGANNYFFPEDLDYERAAGAQYFHFGYPALMESFFSDGGQRLARMMRQMQEKGLVTSLDTAQPDPGSESAGVDWESLLAKALPYVDFFFPSIEELGIMLDRSRYEHWQKKADETGEDICMMLSLEEDVHPLAKKALDLGCGSVLLKCGAAGMYFLSSSEAHMEQIGERLKKKHEGAAFTGKGWGDLAVFQDSFRPDRVLSGTGAGDTAIAGFLYGVSSGMDPDLCLKIAAGCGSMCVTTYDTLSGLLPVDRLIGRIRSGWETQHFIRP